MRVALTTNQSDYSFETHFGTVGYPISGSSQPITWLHNCVATFAVMLSSLVPGAREKRRSAWYTLFAHAFNLPKLWGLRGIS